MSGSNWSSLILAARKKAGRHVGEGVVEGAFVLGVVQGLVKGLEDDLCRASPRAGADLEDAHFGVGARIRLGHRGEVGVRCAAGAWGTPCSSS